MRTIRYNLEIGYAGCNDEGEMQIDDDMTNDQIDGIVHDMALEHAASWEGDERLGWHSDMTEEEYEQETEHFYESAYGSWEFVEYED